MCVPVAAMTYYQKLSVSNKNQKVEDTPLNLSTQEVEVGGAL